MIETVVFVLLSAALIALSWKPLHDRRSHGFHRLFAFEALLALILLNADVWFHEPFSLRQMASWGMLLGSLVLATHGFYMLRRHGRPLGGIENTQQLVRRGAYRLIRHPLYASLLLFAWGVFAKGPELPQGLLAVSATAFLVAAAVVEERECIGKFGDPYLEYMRRTKRFVPYVF